jgi:DNA repair protein RadC
MIAPSTRRHCHTLRAAAPPRIAEMATPRYKLLRGHGDSLSNQEVLSVLLGRDDAQGLAIAARLLIDDSLGRLIPCRAAELLHHGVSRRGAATVLAAYEVARRLTAQEIRTDPVTLDHSEKIARYLILHHLAADQEVLGALYLDCRYRPLASAELFRGTLDRTPVEPRAVVKEALLLGAANVIVFHSHPSGDPMPSQEDLLFTERLGTACSALGIGLLDHLIVTHQRRWVSLRTLPSWKVG